MSERSIHTDDASQLDGCVESILARASHGFRVVSEALARHAGPCDRALLDVIWAYVLASEAERHALFLAAASRALGDPAEVKPADQAFGRPDPRPSAGTSDLPAGLQGLADQLRSALDAIQALQSKAEG